MTEVIMRLQVEGLHRWAEASGEVSYLANPHRHTFFVELYIPVTHDDRDIEIIRMKREVREFVRRRWGTSVDSCDFGGLSCEAIAKAICEEFGGSQCSVFEDNENGARYSYV